jgi:hypothetical protein
MHYNSKEQDYRIMTTHLRFIFMVYLTVLLVPQNDKGWKGCGREQS